jgi:DNA-directed RNA polymerase specialized sigma24 family protein
MSETKQTKAKLKPHYVDNKKFLGAMIEHRAKVQKAEEKKRKAPEVTNYIGECFLKIANHLSYRPNFINYTYRDDMISDGIENCLQYMRNFNPEKSNNPFAYFTQIIYYAFIRRIQKEKKQQDVKAKLIASSGTEMMMDTLVGDDAQYKNQMLEFLQRNVKESAPAEPKKVKKKKKK